MADTICWDAVRRGDKTERDNAVEKYYLVAYKIAHWWARSGQIEESEAIGLANIAIMKCITKGTFDENRNINFSTYLGSAVHNEIRMFLRKERKHREKNRFSLDQTVQKSELTSVFDMTDRNLPSMMTYGSLISDVMSVEDQVEESFLVGDSLKVFKEASKTMTDNELRCISFHLSGYSIRNISTIMKLSQSYTRKLLGSAQQKLKREALKKDLI